MSDTPEQAQFREHLSEIRRAAGGIGRDIRVSAENIDRAIDRLGHTAGKDAKYLTWELEDDLAALAKSIGHDVRDFPSWAATHASAAGAALRDGASEIAERTSDALHSTGKHISQGTRNAMASAAGVRRTPMKEWHTPSAGESARDDA